MIKAIFISTISLLTLLATGNSCYAQTCSQDKANPIQGFYKLKYCMENLGWRESVQKDEWRVTVYNLYDDMKVSIQFNLVEAGAPAKGLGSYTIPKNSSRSLSFYFTSAPDFVYDKIEFSY